MSLLNRLAIALTVLTAGAVGCGGDSTSDTGFATMGMPGIPSPTRVGVNLVFADVAIDGHPGGRLAVDTGSPIMLVDPTKFPGLRHHREAVDRRPHRRPVHRRQCPAVPFQGGSGMDPLNFAGLLGGNVMRQFPVRWTTRIPIARFVSACRRWRWRPSGVEVPGTAVAFNLEGGGLGKFEDRSSRFRRPASR